MITIVLGLAVAAVGFAIWGIRSATRKFGSYSRDIADRIGGSDKRDLD
jgi:hypothetical protein